MHYCRAKRKLLDKYGLKVFSISNHLVGQAVATGSMKGTKLFFLLMSGETVILKVYVNVQPLK